MGDQEPSRVMADAAVNHALVEVQHLTKFFPVRKGLFSRVRAHVRAVDDVSVDIPRGRTLGLVGESGCGKTTLGRTILRLLEPTAGQVRFDGVAVFELGRSEMRLMRRRMQIIFQDPYGSLNPRMTVAGIVGEPLRVHKLARGQELRQKVTELIESVGLADIHLDRYPHEFSGGQRQRIGVARALALGPEFIVCDEPTSALDVSVRAQIINIRSELQEKRDLSYLFISHDLAVVRHISHRVAVMYLGKLVEVADTPDLYQDPLHPYTKVLLTAIPVPDPKTKREKIIIPCDVPSPVNPPGGCPFHPRCPYAFQPCPKVVPELLPVEGQAGRLASCHLVNPL